MNNENTAAPAQKVLAAASAKEKKYYLDPEFTALPAAVQEELKKICIPLAEEFNQNVVLFFDPDGTLLIGTEPDPEDFLYDDIGSGLRVSQMQRAHRELFEQLETYYKHITDQREGKEPCCLPLMQEIPTSL